jgi:hypothetical protein
MPSPYDQYDLILTQRNSSDTHFQEVRVSDVPNTVVSFDGSSTLRTLAYSESDDSGSLIRRDSAGDAAIGSRLYFTDASASNGTTALIGLNASTARDFAIYDYAAGGGYLLNIYSGSKDVEIHGGLIQSGSTRIDSAGNGYFNNLSASHLTVVGSQEIDGYLQLNPVVTNIPNNFTSSYMYVSGSTNDLYFTQNSGNYLNTVRLRWLEGTLSTGLLHGGVLSSTLGSTTFGVTEGEGLIVTMNASTSSAPYPTTNKISWPTQTLPIYYSGSAKITYVGVDAAGAIVQQTIPWGENDINEWDSKITLGVVLHLSGSVSSGVFNAPQISYGSQQKSDDFFRAFGPLKISGHTLQVSGSHPTLSIKKSEGRSYREGANYVLNPNHPSTVVEGAVNTSKIYRYHLSGSVPIIDTGVGNAGYTNIDNTKYYNSATGLLDTVSGGKYSLQRVFWVPNSPTNAFIVYYGNKKYNSLVDATDAQFHEEFVEAPNTALNAIFLGYIAVQGGSGVSLTDAGEATIIQGGIFRSVTGTGASGTTPVSNTLSGLSDVALTTPSTGDLLMYGNGTQWNNTKILNGSYGVSGSLNVQSGVYGNLIGTATSASFVSPSGNAFVQSGNSFGQTAVVGTNDTHSLHLETSGSTRVAITPSGLVGVNTVSPSYTLEVNGTFAANTKSFKIDHPTKEGYKLIYGSLESPYHGVRLTGKGAAVKGYDKVVLPEYIFKLVRHNDINIQITNIRHSRVMYVNEVNVSENYFVIAYDKQMFDGDKTFEFYWDFTAERQDIDKLESEVKV